MRFGRTLQRLAADWLYCLLQGLLSFVDIAFWLLGVVVSPLLALVLGPRLAAALETGVNWLADLHDRLAAWRQRRPRLDDGPRQPSTWRSLRCLGTNALSLPVHVVVLLVFPVAMAWAPLHSRLLGWALSQRLPAAGPEPDRRGGHGLVGMRERVRALGGTLTTGPDDAGGFRVRAVLPLDPTGPVDTGTVPTDRPDQEDG